MKQLIFSLSLRYHIAHIGGGNVIAAPRLATSHVAFRRKIKYLFREIIELKKKTRLFNFLYRYEQKYLVIAFQVGVQATLDARH